MPMHESYRDESPHLAEGETSNLYTEQGQIGNDGAARPATSFGLAA
jgi:hypothetical protein